MKVGDTVKILSTGHIIIVDKLKYLSSGKVVVIYHYKDTAISKKGELYLDVLEIMGIQIQENNK